MDARGFKSDKCTTGVVDVQVNSLSGKERENIIKVFLENATVHGLSHTRRERTGLFRRCFWGVAFFAALAGMFCTVFSQVSLMLTYPYKVETTLHTKLDLPFPAVTLCNLNQFRKSVIDRDPRIRQMVFTLSGLHRAAERINWSDPVWTFDANFSEVFENNLEYIAHPLTDTLKHCIWDYKVYNCSDIFKVQKTDFGICYTFNSRELSNMSQRRATHVGSKYGLVVIADIMQNEYVLGWSSDVAGLRVVLHDPSAVPLVEGKGFDVAPGTATKASLKLQETNYLPPPFSIPIGKRQCINRSIEDFPNFLTMYDSYSVSGCIAECRQNYIFEMCGCRGIFEKGNATLCEPRKQLSCYIPQFEKFMYDGLEVKCKCPVPCSRNSYTADISMAGYPSTPFMEQLQTMFNKSITETEFRRNFLKLTVGYDSFQVETINQTPEYNIKSILSTFGGQLGIFLGASVLSVLELLEFGLDLVIFKAARAVRDLQSKG